MKKISIISRFFLLPALVLGSGYYVASNFEFDDAVYVASTAAATSALPPVDASAVPAEMTAAPFVDTTDQDELLPDLVALPAQDLKVKKADDGRVLLHFSTTYFNQGRGPVELRIEDQKTNVRADIDREVLQRIYNVDGSHREIEVGTFLWHQEHLHYHFNAFVEYDLEAVDAPVDPEELKGSRIKSTFCLRDISRVELDLPNKAEKAAYDNCSKKLQGVSVGWGDTYYWDYPAQNLNISDLPSGTYRFTTRANPEKRLEEINYQNNVSSVVMRIDREKLEVEVLEQFPSETPVVEHVHLDDPFGI